MPINPYFLTKLKAVSPLPASLSVMLEVTNPDKFSEASQLASLLGANITGSAFNFIFATVPIQVIPDLAEKDYITVHYDMPRTLQAFPLPFPSILTEESFPTPGKPLTLMDPIVGEVKVPTMTVPSFKPALLPPAPPLVPPPISQAPQVEMPGYLFIPTSKSRAVVVDTETDLTGKGVLAAVIDTGATPPFHPQVLGRNVGAETTVPEAPLDQMGHGSWCMDTLGGSPFEARLGRVDGVAPEANLLGVKCLTTLGFGTSSSIIKAMEVAYERKARVVSMSLGGDLQGSVDDDPDCKVVEMLSKAGMLFVIAAGNSGPDEWTVGSPGAAPSALTVASMSITDQPQVAYWSSRGPQGAYYKDNPDVYQRDLDKYGEDLLKPDCSAPGGGRADSKATPDELIYSGLTGWFDGYYSILPSFAEGMHGTSQATPHVAGLMTLLAQKYSITAEQAKSVLRKSGHPKTTADGYGLIKLSYFL